MSASPRCGRARSALFDAELTDAREERRLLGVRPLPRIVPSLVFVTATCAVLTGAAPGRADEVTPPPAVSHDEELRVLLRRLLDYGQRFEQMKKRGSYTFAGKLDQLDGDGKVDGTQELVARIIADGVTDPTVQIVKYVDDGEDKTVEAREKAKARGGKPKDKKREFRLPFSPNEQPRYVFTLVERSREDPRKVRIAFVPKVPAEDAYHGSAWVDTQDAEVDSMGFSPSKNPTFVEHIDVTMRFALQTPLGRAPSTMTVDARGGFLFLRKHFRGTATISDARIAP